MNQSHLLAAGLIGIAVGLVLSAFFVVKPTGAFSDGPFYQMTAASSTNIATLSKIVAATTTSRRYLSVGNLSGAAIYCQYNDVPATVTTGFFIAASTSKEWVGETLYTGAIRCIAPTSANIVMSEVY